MTMLPRSGYMKRKLGYALSTALVAALPLLGQTASTNQGATAENDVYKLNVFEVRADVDRGYLSTSSISAGRINTPIANVPQSIFVLTGEMIRDQAPQDLSDVLRYAPGVSVSETNGESVNIRGFAVSIPLQDGFRVSRTFPTEQADIERTEVLLGPASVLYGNIFGVAGVINRITKKAEFTPRTSLQLQLKDQESTQRAVLDSTGPIGNSKKAAYRLIAVAQDLKYIGDFDDLQRYSFIPKVTYKFTENLVLNASYEYTKQTGNHFNNSGARFDYWFNGAIKVMPDKANPFADFTQSDIEKQWGSFILTYRRNDHWSFRVAGQGGWTQSASYLVPVGGSLQTNGTSVVRNQNGNMTQRNRGLGNIFFQADAAGDYTFGKVSIKPVLGVEYSVDSDGTYIKTATTALPVFNYFAPDYTTPYPAFFAFTSNNRTNTFSPAAFALAQVGLLNDRLIINAGTRVTNYEQTVRTVTATTNTKTSEKGKTATVPRYGAVIKVTPALSLYGGYAEGFQVTTGSNPDGSTFKPITGKQSEVGIKGSFLNTRLVFTAAAYKLERVNNPQNDPTRPGYRITTGAQRNEGYDFNFILSLTDNWQIIGGYAHAKGEVAGDVNPANVGQSITGISPDIYNMWTRYSFKKSFLKGLSLGAGTVYVSDTPVFNATTTLPERSIPAYQTYDAMVSYNWKKKIRLQLNVRNITDERYYPDGNANRLQVGQPRTYSLTTTYEF